MKRTTWKNIVQLQAVVVIYTISSVMAKLASASGDDWRRFLLLFGLEFALLGIYAILWQQMIKRFELSVAYSNRAMAIVWSMIWAVILFHNRITLRNLLGVVLVVAGILIINTEERYNGKKKC